MTAHLIPLQFLGTGERFRLPGSDVIYTLRAITTDRRDRRNMRVRVEELDRVLVLPRSTEVEIEG